MYIIQSRPDHSPDRRSIPACKAYNRYPASPNPSTPQRYPHPPSHQRKRTEFRIQYPRTAIHSALSFLFSRTCLYPCVQWNICKYLYTKGKYAIPFSIKMSYFGVSLPRGCRAGDHLIHRNSAAGWTQTCAPAFCQKGGGKIPDGPTIAVLEVRAVGTTSSEGSR